MGLCIHYIVMMLILSFLFAKNAVIIEGEQVKEIHGLEDMNQAVWVERRLRPNWFGLLMFYGISSHVVYLKSNPVYAYIWFVSK